MKPISSIEAPASLPAATTTSATGVLLSMTKSWLSSEFSLRNLARPPSTIFSTILSGLPLSFAFSIAIARSRSMSSPGSASTESASGCGTLERDENADLPEAGSNLIVHVRHDCALPDLQQRCSAKRLILPDLGDIVGQFLLNRTAARILCCTESFDVGPLLQRKLRNVADELLENLVLGDEVCFRIDFDDGTARPFDGDRDQALGGRPARLLCGGGEALRSKPIDRCFHLAVGFRQRLLAVHHAGAGALAQFL